MSPASTRPLPFGSVGVAGGLGQRPACCWSRSSVEVLSGRRGHGRAVGAPGAGGRGVVHRAGVHVGLGDRVGARAGGGRPRRQRGGRAGGGRPGCRRPRRSVSVWAPVFVTGKRVGDPVAGVDPAVAVDVDRRTARSCRRSGWRRSLVGVAVDEAFEVTAASAGVRAGGRRGVGHRAGVHVGLGDRVRRGRRAGGRRVRRQRGRRAGRGPDLRRRRSASAGDGLRAGVGHREGVPEPCRPRRPGRWRSRPSACRRSWSARGSRSVLVDVAVESEFEVTVAPARPGRRGRGRVGHRAGVHVGLGDRVGPRAGGDRSGGERGRRAGGRHDRGVADRGPPSGSGRRCWSR